MEILKRHSRIKQRRERPKKGLKTKQNENKKPFGVQSRKIADMNVNFSLPANEIQVHKKNSPKKSHHVSRFLHFAMQIPLETTPLTLSYHTQ